MHSWIAFEVEITKCVVQFRQLFNQMRMSLLGLGNEKSRQQFLAEGTFRIVVKPDVLRLTTILSIPSD